MNIEALFRECISEAGLKAPKGKFRVIATNDTHTPSEHYFIADYGESIHALDARRDMVMGKYFRRYPYHIRVFNDTGREVGVYGTCITDKELAAPPDQFRLVCIDNGPAISGVRPPDLYLVEDSTDRQDLLEIAEAENNGYNSFIEYHVYDESGEVLA